MMPELDEKMRAEILNPKSAKDSPIPEQDVNLGRAVRAYSKDIDEFKAEPKFYANEETLKQGSGYYDNIDAIPVKGEWLENCQDCKCAMMVLQVNPIAAIQGIPDSVHVSQRSKLYTKWLEAGCAYDNGKIWLCPECKSAWSIISGQFWAKLIIDNEHTFSVERIKPQPGLVIVEEKPFDPGPQPNEESTLCPNCKIWRTVEPYSETLVQHVCSSCKAVDLVRI